MFNAPDLENLPNYNAVMALLVNGIPARPFTIETQTPPPRDYSRIDMMKELSYQTYGKDRAEVEAEIRERYVEKAVTLDAEPNPFNSYL